MTTFAPIQSKVVEPTDAEPAGADAEPAGADAELAGAAADSLPLENGDHLDRTTFHARYSAMPPGTRAELIGGRVYMPSPVRVRHGAPHIEVAFWLTYYKMYTPGVQAIDNATAILAEDSEPQPDVALRVLVGGQTSTSKDDYIVGCPELVCEVAASTVSYDLHEKLADYDRYGAKEYVAVLVSSGVKWFRRNAEGRLAEAPPDADGVFRSTAFPGLWLDPAALLAGDTRKVLNVLTAGLTTAEHASFAAELAGRKG